jgi:hypothetical protein
MKIQRAFATFAVAIIVAGSGRVAAAPGPAALVGVGGAVVSGSPAVFSWNAAAGATWYQLWVNDRTGTQHAVWYTAVDAGCGSGEAVCSITISSALKTGPALWWIRTWDPSGYGPWSAAGRFTVASPGEAGLRLVAQNGGTVGRVVDETKVVRTINGQVVMFRATAAGFQHEGTSLNYESTDCTGEAYSRVDLIPWLKLAGSVSNGYLQSGAVASRLHRSSRSISETGQVGTCQMTSSTFDSMPVVSYDATAELGGLLGPFVVVQ